MKEDGFDWVSLLIAAVIVVTFLQANARLRRAVTEVMFDLSMWFLKELDKFCRDYLIYRGGVAYVVDSKPSPGEPDTPRDNE